MFMSLKGIPSTRKNALEPLKGLSKFGRSIASSIPELVETGGATAARDWWRTYSWSFTKHNAWRETQ
eukprot:3871286-Prorocentrum_lima.AAC.1